MKRIVSVFLFCPVFAVSVPAQTQMPENSTFRQEGVASWYGAEFEGRPTASGELFDPNQFTAAHPTLPFGTFITVTNLQNNNQVRVRVNDRGPYVSSRIIDVSRAAAAKLGIIETGTANVTIEMIPRNSPAGSESSAVQDFNADVGAASFAAASPSPASAVPAASREATPSAAAAGVPAPSAQANPSAAAAPLTASPAPVSQTSGAASPAPASYSPAVTSAAAAVQNNIVPRQSNASALPRPALPRIPKPPTAAGTAAAAPVTPRQITPQTPKTPKQTAAAASSAPQTNPKPSQTAALPAAAPKTAAQTVVPKTPAAPYNPVQEQPSGAGNPAATISPSVAQAGVPRKTPPKNVIQPPVSPPAPAAPAVSNTVPNPAPPVKNSGPVQPNFPVPGPAAGGNPAFDDSPAPAPAIRPLPGSPAVPQTVKQPEPEIEAAPAEPAEIKGGPVVPGKTYRLQIGSFKVPRNAVGTFDKLANAGLNPSWEPFEGYYRIVITGLKAEDLPIVAEKLGSLGFKEVIAKIDSGWE